MTWFGCEALPKIGRKRITDAMNELMNYKGVCRTALATPGLLKSDGDDDGDGDGVSELLISFKSFSQASFNCQPDEKDAH